MLNRSAVDDYYLGIIGWLLLICLYFSIKLRVLMKIGPAQDEQSKADNQDPVTSEGRA